MVYLVSSTVRTGRSLPLGVLLRMPAPPGHWLQQSTSRTTAGRGRATQQGALQPGSGASRTQDAVAGNAIKQYDLVMRRRRTTENNRLSFV
jgi:hypothetical protein